MADNVIQNIGIKATADTGDTVKKLNELSNGLKKVYESAKGIDTKGMSFGQLRQGLQQAQASLRSAEKDIVKYGNTMGQMWRSAKVEEADAKGRIDAFSSALKSLEKQASDMKISIWNEGTPTSSEKYPFGKEEEYTPTQYKFAPIDPSLVGGQELDQNNAKAEETISKFSRLRAKIGEAFSQEKLQNFSDKMSRISAKAGEISGKMGRVARTVGSAGKRFLSAINPMTMFRNEQNKLSLSSTLLGKAFSRLGRMFRIMVTRMLIRGFISNIREGFQNIAKYSDVVNQKFSAIISSAKTLYNAFASAFTPLIEAIAPYVVKALDFITSAMNKVAEFLSALTGKSYFIKATKYQTNYAKSLDKTGKSAGKTAKKVKELKSATIGIDKLNVIEKKQPDTSNSGSGSGAGGGGASANDMFDTKPVSKKMKDLAKEVKKIAKKLFDPIQKAWNSKGAKVLSSFKKMLGSIWSTIKAIGRDFLKVWQQPATVKIFEDILETVSLIFDTIKAISDQFRKAWNKDNVGLHIFENLRDVIGIIVSGIKECIKYTKKWAQHLNFSPLLKSIERYTKSLKKLMKGLVGIASDFYKIVVLGISKWVVEKGLPALIQVFTDFNNKVDWQRLRKSIKVLWKGLEHLAETIGEGLINVLGDLMDALADLLNSKWFQNLIKYIGNLMKSIKPKHIEWFVKAWLGLKGIKFVTGLLGKVGTKLAWLVGKIRWFKYSSVGGRIVGAFKGIGSKIGSILSTVGSKIGTLVSQMSSGTGAISTAISGAFPLAVIGAGAFELGTLYSEIKKAGEEAERLVRTNNTLPKSYQEYLKKLDDANTKLNTHNTEMDDTNEKTLAIGENVKGYKSALDDIVDANGNIKSGYEEQADWLVNQINEALGTNYTIIDKQVQGYKQMNSDIKEQIRLTTKKKLAEDNAKDYYTAKQNIKDKSAEVSKLEKDYKTNLTYYKKYKKLVDDTKRDLEEGNYEDERQRQQMESDVQDWEAKMHGYKNASDTLKKSLDKSKGTYQEYFKDILRQEALFGAKTKKEQEKAIANYNKGLSDKEKNALSSMENLAKLTNKSLTDIIKKYTKDGKIQYDKIEKDTKKIQDKLKKPIKKEIKITTEKKRLEKVYKQIKKAIPKDLFGNVLGGAVKNKFVDPTKAINVANAYKNAKKIGININTKLANGIALKTIDPDTALNYINALSTAKKKGKDISKYIGDGIFKNKGTVKKATDSLKALVNGIPSEKDTTVKVKGKGQYEKDSKDAGDSAKKNVPKKLETTIEIKAKLSAKKIGKRLKKEFKGYTLDQIIKGSGGKRYAIYENKKTGKKKKVLMANGGYPKLGSEFIAGEKGAEFVGNINGKTGVASNLEITGIREEVATQGQSQIALLQQQNKLLMQILEKNTDVNIDGDKLTKKINKINANKGFKMATT